MKTLRISLSVLMILATLTLVGMEADAVFQKDPGTGSGSCQDYDCTWCCETAYGCSDPGAGWHFT